jgi:hypothetical protein
VAGLGPGGAAPAKMPAAGKTHVLIMTDLRRLTKMNDVRMLRE